MSTFLFGWNPREGNPASFAREKRAILRRGAATFGWRSGVRRDLPVGSRAFMIRLGKEPRGIIGAGWTKTEPSGDHPWLRMTFDTLRERPIIPFALLRESPFSRFHWSIQGSGVLIPDSIAEALEKSWASHLAGLKDELGEETIAEGALHEGSVKTVRVNAYERNSRARELCKMHYGCKCAACGMKFGQFYGTDLEDFIHVHHLVPLSRVGARYKVDPIRDLRPICPNCHAVVHSQDPPLSIAQVRARIARHRRSA